MEAFREFKRAVGSRQQDEPRQARSTRASRTQDLRLGADYGHSSRRPTSGFRPTTARSPTRRCDVSASAPAAGRRAATCARATWRRARRSTHARARASALGDAAGRSAGRRLEERGRSRRRWISACRARRARRECPTNVDLATYKAEFLAHYYEGRSRPLHAYAFGMIDRWARLASYAPGLANAVGRFPPARAIANVCFTFNPSASSRNSPRRPSARA